MLASQDLQDLRVQVRRGKKGKAVLEWGLPLEIWHMILFPNAGKEPRTLGVGAEQGRIKNSFTFRRIREVLTLVRRADAPPLDASRPSAFKLDKRNGAKGIKRLRLIHIMCPFWKAFYVQGCEEARQGAGRAAFCSRLCET